MKKLFQNLLISLATATGCDFANKIQFLLIENDILRGKLPDRITITSAERNRLLKYGKLVGSAISNLITIVTPRTFQRWLSQENSTPKHEPVAKVGRPPTDEDIRKLVLRLAAENSWGYTRIHGELKKLGVTSISRTTIANILRAEGIDPSPERSKGTWHQFIKQHAATLWACDFFTKKIWTTAGLLEYYVLFFIHVGSRRVIVTGMTPHPDATWVLQQARNFMLQTDNESGVPTHLIHDCDTKFTKAFDALFKAEGMEVVTVGPAAPNLNAHAERFVLTMKSECLDHFIVFGEDHFRYLIKEQLEHYHLERPHQGIGNTPIAPVATPPPIQSEIHCRERLGGLLKHYHRQAA
jgi:putative transposase